MKLYDHPLSLLLHADYLRIFISHSKGDAKKFNWYNFDYYYLNVHNFTICDQIKPYTINVFKCCYKVHSYCILEIFC